MTTVIIGGGIIGLSTAYYLSQNSKRSIHVIDSSPTLFTSASGHAGGFLAENWFSPSVASLGALSFRLHREIAEANDGRRKWGYAGTHVYSLSVDERGVSSKAKSGGQYSGGGEDWIEDGTSRAQVATSGVNTSGKHENGGDAQKDEMVNFDGSPTMWTPQIGGTLDTISTSDECAQVEPRELCEFLLTECKRRGVQVHLSTKATGVRANAEGVMQGLTLHSTSDSQDGGTELDCTNVVISAGAWTPRVFKTLFPRSKLRIPIQPLAGHSIVVKSPRYKTPFFDLSKRGRVAGDDSPWLCYSIYCAPGRYWSYAPEAFARLARNGETEVWLGGLNDSSLPLPDLSTDVKGLIDPESIKDLRRTTVRLTGLAKEGDELNEDDLETIREGLCFRPVSQRGTPLVGKVPDKHLTRQPGEGGVYIASGHGPWGISLSLGTGKVVSEMIMGKKTSADVKALRVSS